MALGTLVGHVTVITQRQFQQFVEFFAFGSVPRQSGGHSSCMQILVCTVHFVQQNVEISQLQFWGWLSTRLLLSMTGALVGSRRKLWSSAVAVLVGVVQFLDKVVVPVGATTLGRAMHGSTMDTCLYIIQGGFWKKLRFFLHEGVGSGMFHAGFYWY